MEGVVNAQSKELGSIFAITSSGGGMLVPVNERFGGILKVSHFNILLSLSSLVIGFFKHGS